MSASRIASVGVGLVALAFTVGCAGTEPETHSSAGSSATTTTLDAAFRARAETSCAPYGKYHAGHLFPVSGFNRFDPDVHLLPRVGKYLARDPSYRTLVSELDALGQPDSGAAAWRTVMGDLSTGEKLGRKLIDSARRAKSADFVRFQGELEENATSLHTHLRMLGLSGGSSCYGVQTDPFEAAPAE
jgi:hypothetical protein